MIDETNGASGKDNLDQTGRECRGAHHSIDHSKKIGIEGGEVEDWPVLAYEVALDDFLCPAVVHGRVGVQVQEEGGKPFIGIVGARGVGKTVLLKQIANAKPESFYLSADTLSEPDLFEIAKILAEQYKIKTLLIDEIHFCDTYQQDLKKIFDFLDIRVIFTSSVALSLHDSAHDLSRRVRLSTMSPFSFREYLKFTKGVNIPPLTLSNILDGQWSADHMRFNYLFDEYLRGGLFPFALEEPDILPLLENVCQKIVQKDIPRVHNLRVDDIDIIQKMVAFIGKADVDGINFTSLSKNLGITKYKAEQFVRLLYQAYILNPVYPAGTNVLQEPKILMFLPFRLLYRDWSSAVGAVREDFVAEMLTMKGLKFHYLKSTRGAKTPDFLVLRDDGNLVIEVGGKGKGRQQFKGIEVGQKIILSHTSESSGRGRPLSLLGFIV